MNVGIILYIYWWCFRKYWWPGGKFGITTGGYTSVALICSLYCRLLLHKFRKRIISLHGIPHMSKINVDDFCSKLNKFSIDTQWATSYEYLILLEGKHYTYFFRDKIDKYITLRHTHTQTLRNIYWIVPVILLLVLNCIEHFTYLWLSTMHVLIAIILVFSVIFRYVQQTIW